MRETITLRGPHGIYQCTPTALDVMIARHLPARGLNELREKIEELHGESIGEITSVGEALMILAQLSGYGLNPEIGDEQYLTSTVIRRLTQNQEHNVDRLMQGAEWVVVYYPDEGFEYIPREVYLSYGDTYPPVAMFADEEEARRYCNSAPSPK